jgi:hypothetical protein
MNEYFKDRINKVAETQFFLRPFLVSLLKKSKITNEGRALVGNYNTYYDYWQASFNDMFFDMGNFIRLGSEIELCLRQYYMDKKGYNNLLELYQDPNYEKNIFQRIQNWQNKGVINLFKMELGYDLTTNKELIKIQEIMVHRHLYVHNSGLVDDEYIKRIKDITGYDLTQEDEIIRTNYPQNDVYYFKPLKKLNEFIEDCKRFFGNFP